MTHSFTIPLPRFLRTCGIAIALLCAAPATAQSLDDLDVMPVAVAAPGTTEAGKTTVRTYALHTAERFNGVMIRGYTESTEVSGAIRFEGESEWRPLTFLRGPRDVVFLAGYRDDTYRAGSGFTLRLQAEAGAPLEIEEAGVFDNRRDEDRQAPESAPRTVETTAGQIVPPTLINRSAWSARPFIGTPEPLANPTYTRMSFHHAACCSAYTYEEGLAQLKAIQIFHQDVRGWSDIGYQFLLDQEGRLYQGRPFLDNRPDLAQPPRLAMGAHVGNANTGNIGVSVLGCYHPAEGSACEDVLSPAAYDSLIAIFAYLSENYRVPAANLLGHRDQGDTSCPGDNNYALLPGIRTDIDRLIAEGNAPIAFASLTASADDEGVVQLSWDFSEVIDVSEVRIEREAGGRIVTVYRGPETTATTWSDATVPAAGEVIYRLIARSASGREQRLAEAPVAIGEPASYLLTQSFPNPTRNAASLRYYLPRDGFVRVSLYSATGERLLDLVDAYQDGERWYIASVDVAGLASGTYLYQMTVEGFAGVEFSTSRTLTVVR